MNFRGMTRMYKEEIGDLFTANHQAIAHGCNLHGLMGAGIAAQFRRRWPQMYQTYLEACQSRKFKLGSILPYQSGFGMVVYCLGTQEYPGPDASLEAIREAIIAALDDCYARGITELAIPRIGAGIGGLAWEDVRGVLQVAAKDHPVDLLVVSLPGYSEPLAG